MKKSLRIKAAALVATCLVTMAGGCAKKEKTADTTKSNTKAEYAITEKPTELTLFLVRSSDKRLEELPVWEEFARLTNVSLKTVSSKSISDVNQAFNTMMASGNLPDIIALNDGRDSFSKYGVEGAFAKIDELLDDETPNLAKQFKRKVVKNFITAEDGHIYYVPCLNPLTVSAGWFLRKDWLEKLGLEMPTNTEEYYNVLKAFREQDPNGNGKKDEIPYFSRMNTVDDLLGLWDVRSQWDEKDGKVFYSPASEKYREAYTNISKWYGEELIDKEIYTRGAKTRDKLLGENVGGSTHDWFGTTAQFNQVLEKTVPGINFVPFAPPTGHEYYSRDEVSSKGVAISESSEKKDIAVKFIDFIFSDVGTKLKNFGIEGEHYDTGKDGRPYFKDWILHGEKTTVNILEDIGAQGGIVGMQDFWYEEQWLRPEAREGANEYLDNGYLVPQFPTLSYTKEEKSELNKIMTAVKTHVSECTQKWVLGASDIDAEFDKYVKELNSMGLEKAVKIQQAAYDRYVKDNK